RRHRDDAVHGSPEERQGSVRRWHLGRAELRDHRDHQDHAAHPVTLPLLLASASPRRREMLERVGFALEVHPADIDEQPQGGEAPEAYVARIARAKAIAVARRSDLWVLAADTTVTLDKSILGKPDTPEEATKMLRWLSGRTHQVVTAFIVIGERDEKTVIRE